VSVVEVLGVSKAFNGREVLRGISFTVESGEIFGLLGPNGAGKTTTIRMLMDIIKPDSGTIRLFGTTRIRGVKERVGYLPEERGLYGRVKVLELLGYFARLKGLGKREAEKRAEELLERVGMAEQKHRKINELSKGMQQKIQFISAVVHDPELVILDEPFSGLDPVNTKLIKDIILEMKAKGKTVILSTHLMEQAERMCDRILMINRGEAVLYGELSRIKARYGRNTVVVEFEGELPELEGVEKIEDFGRYAEITLREGASPQHILSQLVAKGVVLTKFQVASPSLGEIFVDVVEGRG